MAELTSDSLAIRDAMPDEAERLTDLALRSKAHWGYSRKFMEACRDELTVGAKRFNDEDYQCVVALQNNSIVGYYALQFVSRDIFELDALFVEPGHIGKGVGRSLMRHAIRRLSENGISRLIIQGDPNATEFYLAAGARQVGQRESGSINGRFLPLYEIDLTTA